MSRATITKKATQIGNRTVRGPEEVTVHRIDDGSYPTTVAVTFDDGDLQVEEQRHFDNVAVYRTIDSLYR